MRPCCADAMKIFSVWQNEQRHPDKTYARKALDVCRSHLDGISSYECAHLFVSICLLYFVFGESVFFSCKNFFAKSPPLD